MEKSIYTIIFLLVAFTALGQEDIKIEERKITGGQAARENIKKGDKYYEMHTKANYIGALNYYLKNYENNANLPALNYKIGVCYLYSQQKHKALDYLTKAYNQNSTIASDILLLKGEAHQIHYEFDTAITYYEKYKQKLSPEELNNEERYINKKIRECEFAKKKVNNPARVLIENMGAKINSKYPDYAPLISADESLLIFTSRRPSTTGGEKDLADMMFYEDIYYSKNIDGQWQEAKKFGEPINTESHDATVGLSYDGDHLFIFKNKRGGDIYESVHRRNQWSEPLRLPKNINSKYNESSGCYSFDEKKFYFTSSRPEGYGKKDIYVVTKKDNGKWSDAKNLGAAVNTPYNEEGIFVVPDGRTIYFSSKGHNTMGGYDVFKSEKKDNGKWSPPENLGHPVNTPGDDVFFVISADGKHGYISSSRDNSLGYSDIYKITFLGEEKPQYQSTEDNLIASMAQPMGEVSVAEPEEVEKTRLTLFKGKVLDSATNEPIKAKIIISDNTKNKKIYEKESDAKTGEFMASLPSGNNYAMTIKADGYLFHSQNFKIPQDRSYNEINKTIKLINIKAGAKVVLNNIFFDTGKAKLRSSSSGELTRIKTFLKKYPEVTIEISGHTDNTGSFQYNKKLSVQRAKAVADYLENNGISAERLNYKGYSSSRPIATNSTKEGRQKNRRVEFKILSH